MPYEFSIRPGSFQYKVPGFLVVSGNLTNDGILTLTETISPLSDYYGEEITTFIGKLETKPDGTIVGSGTWTYSEDWYLSKMDTDVSTHSPGTLTSTGSGTWTATMMSSELRIKTQPASQKLVQGGSATFTVVAAGGTGVKTYQWYKNGVAIGGATGSSYNISNLQPDDAAAYKVKVTDGAGAKVTSTAAILTVDPKGSTPISGNPAKGQTRSAATAAQSMVAGPVDTATGAESFSRTLLGMNGLRPLDFTVDYNSLQVTTNGDLGYGWTHPWLATATEALDGSEVTIRWSSAQSYTYRVVNTTAGSSYQCAVDGVRYDVLIKDASGTFTLTKPDGTVYSFDANGRLGQVANRNGQRIVVNRSADGTALDSLVEPVSGATLHFTYTSGRITTISDSASRSVSLGYNSSGLLTQFTDVNGNKTTCAYDSNRRLTTVVAPDGGTVTTNTYDSLGRVASQGDGIPEHKLMRFEYDETSQPGKVVTTVMDRTDARTLYVHDSQYRLISVTDPLDNTTTFTYDSNGNRTGMTDALGHTTTFTYDDSGNLLSKTDGEGQRTTFTYDENHNLLTVVNSAGKTATYRYDAQNNLTELTDFSGNRTVLAYGENSLLSENRSPRGNATSFDYTNGRLTTLTDPLSRKTTFAYDTAGRLTGITDPAGMTSSFTYSPSGKLLSQTDALGNQTSHTYDSRDRLVTTTDPLGGLTQFTYDANNNLQKKTDALNGVTHYAYDGEDRLVELTNPLGAITRFAYDAAGRLVTVTDPLGNVARFEYDAAGNRIASYDALGTKVSQINFDARDLPTTVIDVLGRNTKLAYDALGNLAQQTDPLGKITSYGYDPESRLTQSTDPQQLISRQTFDAEGNRIGLTNPAGATTAFAYNEANELTTLTTAGNRTTSYSYDVRRLLDSVVDPAGKTTTTTFDEAGRMIKLVDDVGQIDYSYDRKGRLLTVTEGIRGSARVYDALDRLTKYTDCDGNVLTYAYDASGNLTELTYPDGKKVTSTYDAANRLTGVTDWANRTTQYAYDANSRLTKTTRPNGTVQTRTYDKAGQLTSLVDLAKDRSTIVRYDFSYDAAGRLVNESRKPEIPAYVPPAQSLTYDADNRLTTYAGQTVNHDANGNMLAAPFNGSLGELTFDARNRLISAAGSTYSYDAENHRIQSSTAGDITRYVVNPNATLSQVLVSIAASGSTTRYVYGLGLIYQDTDDATMRYLHPDFRGSTVALSGSEGTVTGRIDYGPFGEINTRSGDTDTSFLFSGHSGVQTDSNGLVYMRARYYHPQLGRFVSQDPLLGSLTSAGSLNRYLYAGGNPISFIDPTGFARWGVAEQPVPPLDSIMNQDRSSMIAAFGGTIATAGRSASTFYLDPVVGGDFNDALGKAWSYREKMLAQSASSQGAAAVRTALAAGEVSPAVTAALVAGSFAAGYLIGDIVVNQIILGLPPSFDFIPDATKEDMTLKRRYVKAFLSIRVWIMSHKKYQIPRGGGTASVRG